MSRILGKKGADPRISGNVYKAAMKANLLPGADTWVMPPWVGRILDGFHNRFALRIAKMHPMRDMMGRWVYPRLEEVMTTVGLEEVETYVLQLHNNFSQYISTRTILELCLADEQQTVAWVTMGWWDQADLDLGNDVKDMEM